MEWYTVFRGMEYILAIIGLLDIIWGIWKLFLRRSPVGEMLLVARLDGNEEQVEGQARALLRLMDAWRGKVRLVVASQPACCEILQHMEKDGAALHVCQNPHAMVWLQQVEEEVTQGAILHDDVI